MNETHCFFTFTYKAEENHVPGWNKGLRGKAEEAKIGGVRIRGNLDKVEPPEEEADTGRPTEARAIPDLLLAEGCVQHPTNLWTT